jgi:hypothetical protein
VRRSLSYADSYRYCYCNSHSYCHSKSNSYAYGNRHGHANANIDRLTYSQDDADSEISADATAAPNAAASAVIVQ